MKGQINMNEKLLNEAMVFAINNGIPPDPFFGLFPFTDYEYYSESNIYSYSLYVPTPTPASNRNKIGGGPGYTIELTCFGEEGESLSSVREKAIDIWNKRATPILNVAKPQWETEDVLCSVPSRIKQNIAYTKGLQEL